MKRMGWTLAAAMLAVSTPALADVKTGYDMWQRGDFFGAVREWRPAAIAGDPIAQYNLARAYQLGRGVPTDLKMAESWFGKAAAQGHQPSRDNYGLMLFQNGDRQAAMPYIEESANRGDPRAQYVLGTALFNGDILKKDWVRAYAMMTRASAAGVAAAGTSLAQMDRYIPVEQRQRGLALARTVETAGTQLGANMIGDTLPTPSSAPSPRAPIERADPPPSTVGAPPVPKPVRTPPPVKVAVATPKPAPKPVAEAPRPAPQPVASGGNWRVQLGAFSSETNARRAWANVGGRLGGLSASFVRAGNVVRLQAGPLRDRAAAQRACAASGTSCIAVAP